MTSEPMSIIEMMRQLTAERERADAAARENERLRRELRDICNLASDGNISDVVVACTAGAWAHEALTAAPPAPTEIEIVEVRAGDLTLSAEDLAAPPAPPAARHEYDGACRNVQHAATGKCRCNHVSNGRRCGLSRMAPIHAAAGQGE